MNGTPEQFMPSLRRLSTCTLERYQTSEQQSKNKLEEDTEASEHIRLRNLLHKYRVFNIQKLFVSKLRRGLTSSPPATEGIVSREEEHNKRWIKGKGVEITYKSFESKVMLGDIVMSLIIFYISVLQAFIEDFRVTQADNGVIAVLKTVAIMFEFSKILIKCIKQEFVNGVKMVYLTDIIRHSAGVAELVLYFSAITIILLSMVVPVNQTVGVVSFLIATVKLLKMPQNLKTLQIYFIDSNNKQQYWDLVKVILFNLLFGHFISGILMGMAQINQENNWIRTHNLVEASWHEVYFWAYYWSASLISTTGFGDYAAVNSSEAVIVAFLEMFSSIVLVININLIGTIVAKIRNADLVIQKKLAVFRRMNDQNPISLPLQRQIQCYISYEKKLKDLFQFQQRNLLLHDFPEQLKEEYLTDITRSTFSKLPFFRHLRHETMVLLAKHFQHRVYYPGEYLHRSQQHSQRSVFILCNGSISNAYYKPSSKINGSVVEEMKTNLQREAKDPPILLTDTFLNRCRDIQFDIVAATYSLTMSLPEEELLDIIRQSELDKQHFFTIYDKHESNFIFTNEVCPFCDKQYHSKFECPKIHFIPMKSHVLDKHLKRHYRPMPRIVNYHRIGMRKEHCYFLRNPFYIQLEEIQEINPKKHYMNLLVRGSSYRLDSSNERIQEEDFLRQCELMMRKALDQLDTEKEMSDYSSHNLDCDILKDFFSYFTECNPKGLVSTPTRKKENRPNIIQNPLYTHKLYRTSNRRQERRMRFQQMEQNERFHTEGRLMEQQR